MPRTFSFRVCPGLQVFRCLDNAGASGYNKSSLVKLAVDVTRMIKRCGMVNRLTAFRIPTVDLSTFEDKERLIFPDLPVGSERVRDWEQLRDFLPELSKAVILRFLQEANPTSGLDSRVWYRGMQRVMDMGNLSRLWATRPEGGIMWVGFR